MGGGDGQAQHSRALLGVGSAGEDRPNWWVAGRIALVWALTFPGCLAIGFWMARLSLAALS